MKKILAILSVVLLLSGNMGFSQTDDEGDARGGGGGSPGFRTRRTKPEVPPPVCDPLARQTFHLAKGTAALIDDPYHRAYVYDSIADAQVEANDMVGARQTAVLAREAAAMIVDDDSKAWAGGMFFRDIAVIQMDADDMPGAMKTAEMAPDASCKAQIYREVINVQIEAGDLIGAGKTLAMIPDNGDGDIAFYKTHACCAIAKALLKAGNEAESHNNFDQARKAAARINVKSDKESAYSDLIRTQLEAGYLAGAKETLEGMISNNYIKRWAFIGVVEAQAKSGDVVGAKETAEMVGDDYVVKSRAFIAIGKIQFEGEDMVESRKTFDQAAKVAALITGYTKNEAHIAIVEEQAETGDVAGAKETAKMVDDDYFKRQAYLAIVKVQAKSGDVAGAKETSKMIDKDYIKRQAHIAIVEAQAEAGDVSGAKETMRMIDDDGKSPAYGAIANAQIKAGDVAGAKETVEKIDDNAHRIKFQVYITIAWLQAEAEDEFGSYKTFDQARKVAAKIRNDEEKRRAYSDLFSSQASAGDLIGIWKTATMINEDDRKNWIYLTIAKAQVKAGDVDGAKETASMINDDRKEMAYHTIAEVQVNAGDLAGARETAEMVSDYDKAWIYFYIAQTQAKTGEVIEAMETAATISDNLLKALAYSSIAVSQAKARHPASTTSVDSVLP